MQAVTEKEGHGPNFTTGGLDKLAHQGGHPRNQQVEKEVRKEKMWGRERVNVIQRTTEK